MMKATIKRVRGLWFVLPWDGSGDKIAVHSLEAGRNFCAAHGLDPIVWRGNLDAEPVPAMSDRLRRDGHNTIIKAVGNEILLYAEFPMTRRFQIGDEVRIKPSAPNAAHGKVIVTAVGHRNGQPIVEYNEHWTYESDCELVNWKEHRSL